MDELEPIIHCSFCDKTQEEVSTLVTEAGVYICDECITLCYEIISKEGE